jgi:hypothetical protein
LACAIFRLYGLEVDPAVDPPADSCWLGLTPPPPPVDPAADLSVLLEVEDEEDPLPEPVDPDETKWVDMWDCMLGGGVSW